MNTKLWMRALLMGLGVGLTILIAACGNGGAAPSPSGGSAAPSVGTAGVTLGTPAVHIAATDQLQFSPSMQTAHVGDVVQWTNAGTVQHTVTFDSYPSLSDPTLAPGGTWEIKFAAAGMYPYRCTIHPGMNGTIVVK